MSSRTDALHAMMFDALTQGARPAEIAAVPPHRRVLTPAERRAEESTRVAREMTDGDADKRREATARLKAARLAKEAEAQAQAALEPVKKKKATRKKA